MMNREELQAALYAVNDHYEQGQTSQEAEAKILACYDEQRAEIARLQAQLATVKEGQPGWLKEEIKDVTAQAKQWPEWKKAIT